MSEFARCMSGEASEELKRRKSRGLVGVVIVTAEMTQDGPYLESFPDTTHVQGIRVPFNEDDYTNGYNFALNHIMSQGFEIFSINTFSLHSSRGNKSMIVVHLIKKMRF